MRRFFYLLLFGWFLALGQSEISCNVTQTPNETFYKLLNISASNCTYNWSYRSKVFSTNRGNLDGVVLDSSINSLLTHACYEEVTYICFCRSENEPTTATCKTSCSVSSPNNGGEKPGSSPKNGETSPNHIVVPVSVLGGSLLLIIVVVVVLRKMRGHKSKVLPPKNSTLDV